MRLLHNHEGFSQRMQTSVSIQNASALCQRQRGGEPGPEPRCQGDAAPIEAQHVGLRVVRQHGRMDTEGPILMK